LRDQQDLHNKFIDNFLLIFQLISKYVDINEKIQIKINEILKIKEKAQLYFEKEIRVR
jgi:hypothetical protein